MPSAASSEREHRFVHCITCAGLLTALRREPMSGTYDRARRYCDRANECIQIIASSQTPGTGTIYLLIAEHYLRLAASEKKKESNRSSIRRPTETREISAFGG